jgi:hypothetical protein
MEQDAGPCGLDCASCPLVPCCRSRSMNVPCLLHAQVIQNPYHLLQRGMAPWLWGHPPPSLPRYIQHQSCSAGSSNDIQHHANAPCSPPLPFLLSPSPQLRCVPGPAGGRGPAAAPATLRPHLPRTLPGSMAGQQVREEGPGASEGVCVLQGKLACRLYMSMFCRYAVHHFLWHSKQLSSGRRLLYHRMS